MFARNQTPRQSPHRFPYRAVLIALVLAARDRRRLPAARDRQPCVELAIAAGAARRILAMRCSPLAGDPRSSTGARCSTWCARCSPRHASDFRPRRGPCRRSNQAEREELRLAVVGRLPRRAPARRTTATRARASSPPLRRVGERRRDPGRRGRRRWTPQISIFLFEDASTAVRNAIRACAACSRPEPTPNDCARSRTSSATSPGSPTTPGRAGSRPAGGAGLLGPRSA